MKFIFNLAFLTVCIAFMISCSGSDGPTGPDLGTGGGGSGSGSGSSSTKVDSPLHVEVKTNYIGSSQKSSLGTCTVPRTATFGTILDCTMRMPELNMFYSDFEFFVSTNSRTTCKLISFAPYAYRRSVSDDFVDALGNTVECSLGQDPVCFGGAAKNILAKAEVPYPGNSGIYFLTSSHLQQTYKMDAPDTTRASDNYRAAHSTNTAVANNLRVAARGTSLPSGHPHTQYVANSMRDYVFQCREDFGEVAYQINLVISDDDILDTLTQTTLDSIWDWTDL